MSAKPTIPDVEKWTVINCDCGKKCGAYLKRLQRVRCDCGRIYMCLQPRRGGGYVLHRWYPFPWNWPGFEHLKPQPLPL